MRAPFSGRKNRASWQNVSVTYPGVPGERVERGELGVERVEVEGRRRRCAIALSAKTVAYRARSTAVT